MGVSIFPHSRLSILRTFSSTRPFLIISFSNLLLIAPCGWSTWALKKRTQGNVNREQKEGEGMNESE